MPEFKDQLGRTITLPDKLRRIISTVPSQTELLSFLGLDDKVIGITKFCVHPREWRKSKNSIGGTKSLKLDIIDSLHPDLIIANKEENTKEQIDELLLRYPVWISDVNDLEDACAMISSIGEMTSTENKAVVLINDIQKSFKSINRLPGIPASYLIWRNPYMTIGGDTFIHDMLKRCGLTNIFSDRERYPVINIDDIKRKGCKILLLPSEPFPFKRKHIEELSPHLPGVKIFLVDGEMFSWYGSRLLQAPGYLKTLLEEIRSSA